MRVYWVLMPLALALAVVAHIVTFEPRRSGTQRPLDLPPGLTIRFCDETCPRPIMACQMVEVGFNTELGFNTWERRDCWQLI